MNLHPDIAAVIEGRSPWTVVTGDCLAVLPTLPAGCVDCVVTDPPYGVRADEWDDMDSMDFARLSMAWLSEARRVSSECIAFGTSFGAVESLMRMLYPAVRKMIWYKPLGSQYNGAQACRRFYAHEPIYHGYSPVTWEVVKPKDRAVAELIREAREAVGLSRGAVDMAIRGKRTGLCYRWEEAACIPTPEQAVVLKKIIPLDGRYDEAVRDAYENRDDTLELAAEQAAGKAAGKIDVLAYRTETDGEHPCKKPVGLMKDILSTLDASVILDPFAGSGTTGVACVQTGRRFIGIEIDEKYAAIARRRIADAAPLFVPPPTPAPAELFGGGA